MCFCAPSGAPLYLWAMVGRVSTSAWTWPSACALRPLERQIALIQGRFQAPKKRVDIVMARIVIEDLIQNPFVLSIVDGRQYAIGPLIEFIDSHIARKGLKRPVQKRTAHLTLRLFSPQPRPSFGSWQRAQTHGDRATGASWQGGRASRFLPPGAPPV